MEDAGNRKLRWLKKIKREEEKEKWNKETVKIIKSICFCGYGKTQKVEKK